MILCSNRKSYLRFLFTGAVFCANFWKSYSATEVLSMSGKNHTLCLRGREEAEKLLRLITGVRLQLRMSRPEALQ